MTGTGIRTLGVGKKVTNHLQLLKSMADDPEFFRTIREYPKFKAYLKRRDRKRGVPSSTRDV